MSEYWYYRKAAQLYLRQCTYFQTGDITVFMTIFTWHFAALFIIAIVEVKCKWPPYALIDGAVVFFRLVKAMKTHVQAIFMPLPIRLMFMMGFFIAKQRHIVIRKSYLTTATTTYKLILFLKASQLSAFFNVQHTS